MSYKARSLFRMLEDISRNDLLLPHIQRPFVWDDEQMIRLFDSLMRNYPIQTFLFWRTKESIKARRFMNQVDRDAELSTLYDDAKSAEGVEKVFVLDGQQRLQTLYSVFCGLITDSAGAATEAYFDATGGAVEIDGSDLLHKLQFSATLLPPKFYRLRNLMERDAQKDAMTIAEQINDTLTPLLQENADQKKIRERQVLRNMSQLRTLLREEMHFWVEELDGIANSFAYRKILDIFVRVNSGGTKLTSSDLMFAAMKEGWEEVEEHTEQTVEMLNDGRLSFETSFPLRCLLVSHGEGAEVTTDKFIGARGEALLTKLKGDWDKSEQTFQQLRDFIEHDLRIFSDKVIRSYTAFTPLYDYLFHHPKPDERNRILMRAYYNKAQLFNWYGSSTDTAVNAVHSVIAAAQTADFPLQGIKDYFANSRGLTVSLSDTHLSDNRLRSIILSMVYVERWGTSPFRVLYKGNEPHVDHIYPQYMLRNRLSQRSPQINDIGNLRFVGATDNIRKRAELPASYFGRLKADGVNIANHLLITEYSDNPERMVFDEPTYTHFRQARRAEVFAIAKRIVDPELPPT